MADAEAISRGGGARPGAFAIWFQAIRPWSLTAAVVPVLLGTAVAVRAGHFAAGRLVLALVGAMAIQAGTNLVNDYYDYLSGADTSESLGPSMVIQRGLLEPIQVWWGGITAFALGSVLGLILVYLCGWPILAIGLLSVAAGYFYTAAPVALGYAGLGELTVFLFMGPAIVVGAYYVMAFSFSWTALWASIPLGFLVAGILHTNNIRDIESDPVHGKRTLASALGRKGATMELIALDAAAYLTTLVAVLAREMPWTMLLVMLTLPRVRSQLGIVRRETEPKRLNLALFRSIQVHLEFGALSILAFLAAALFGL
jgi:1,4-dihydroxy-2-naphthoate octaprenyltransferase